MSKSDHTADKPTDADGDADHAGVPTDDPIDYVTEDPDLLPVEKETTIRFDKTTDTARLFTAEAGLMRRVLQHPYSEVVRTDERDGEIHGLHARLPVGCLLVRRDPRESDGHADVVTRTVLTTGDGEE